MFNFNIPASSLLGYDTSALCSTPKTPEIVNSLIAMTNPLDNFHFASNPNLLSSYPGQTNSTKTEPLMVSQDSSQSSFSASPLQSPAGINATPSVQQTCSQLIKAGLKLSIQSKRKISSCESSSGNEQPSIKCHRIEDDCDDSTDEEIESKILPKGLTPEDEDRRRRRRERNKIAATKCRMKKRERTNNLIKESEQLDSQNVDLKSQVRSLELERRKLFGMLESHRANCAHEKRLSMLLKYQKSPAAKYFAELNLDESKNIPEKAAPVKTAIPPMSSIKFAQKNGFKENEVPVGLGFNGSLNGLHDYPLMPLSNSNICLETLTPGYCKVSPVSSQEVDYFQTAAEEAGLSHVSLKVDSMSKNPGKIVDELVGAAPPCENPLKLSSSDLASKTESIDTTSPSALINDLENQITIIQSSNDFVKHEFVESQSPYTTAQSAERFLFENNCESFIDIKQVMHSNCNSNQENIILNNNNNNSMDFNTSVMNSTNLPSSFNDSLSLKNDFLHEADLLAQLTADGTEFTDLDSSVASVFLANGGCLA